MAQKEENYDHLADRHRGHSVGGGGLLCLAHQPARPALAPQPSPRCRRAPVVGAPVSRWREHAERARDLLGQAQVAANPPLKAVNHLYDALVSLVQAINELEQARRDQGENR